MLLTASVAGEVVLEDAAHAGLAYVEERVAAADAEESAALPRTRQGAEMVPHRVEA